MADPPTNEPETPMDTDAAPKSILSPGRTKRHGATVVLAAEEVKTSFTADFTFSTANGASNKLNLGNLHRLLFKHMLEVTEDHSIRLLPTQENSQATTIGDLTLFPRVEKEHRAFFHRSTYHVHERNQLKIRVKHTMISKTPITTIRNKIMPWLRANDIYLRSSAFDREDTVCIAWILGAHPKLSFRPAFEDEINTALQGLTLNDEQNQELSRICDDQEKTLPKIFVSPRTQNYGNGNLRVSSNTLGICCIKRHAKLLKELTAEVNMGGRYRIIPQGLRQMASESVYRKFLIANNDLQNNLRSIAVIGLIPQAMDWEFYVESEDDTFTMRKLFTEIFGFYSVEKTHNTDITGRFLFVVTNDNYVSARQHLTLFLENNFLGHDNAVGYDAYFDMPGPKLASAPPPGGCIQQCVDRLVAELDETEATGGALQDKPKAWQSTTTHIHFDLDDVETFPDLNDKPTVTPPSGAQSIAPTRSMASKSGVSTAGASTDMSTIVSEMQTMVSAQSQLMDTFMKQQAEQFKQQQAITTQEISSLITLVTQLIPTNRSDFPPPPQMYYPQYSSPHYPGTYSNPMPHPKSPTSSASDSIEDDTSTHSKVTTAKPPPPTMTNGLIFSRPGHMARPKSPTLSTLRPAGKVMDIETPERRTKVNANTITPNAAGQILPPPASDDTRFILPNAPKKPNPNSPRGPKRSEHPSETPPRPNPGRSSYSTPERLPPPPAERPLPPPAPDPGLAKKLE